MLPANLRGAACRRTENAVVRERSSAGVWQRRLGPSAADWLTPPSITQQGSLSCGPGVVWFSRIATLWCRSGSEGVTRCRLWAHQPPGLCRRAKGLAALRDWMRTPRRVCHRYSLRTLIGVESGCPGWSPGTLSMIVTRKWRHPVGGSAVVLSPWVWSGWQKCFSMSLRPSWFGSALVMLVL